MAVNPVRNSTSTIESVELYLTVPVTFRTCCSQFAELLRLGKVWEVPAEESVVTPEPSALVLITVHLVAVGKVIPLDPFQYTFLYALDTAITKLALGC